MTNKIIFESPSGASKGSNKYFEEAMEAGFYGCDDNQTYAYKIA